MSALEIAVTIGSVTLNANYSPGASCYVLQSTEEILGALKTRRTETPRQGEHSSEDSISFFEPRVLLFKGEMHATSQSQRVAMEQALDSAVSLPRQQSFAGDDGYKLVLITDEDGVDKQLYAKIDQMPQYSVIDDGMPESRTFEFIMFASDIAIYAQELTEITAPESYNSTTFTFQDEDLPTFQDGALPTIQDIQGQILQVNNEGTFGSPPLIVLNGPTTNPVIENETTGKKLSFTRNGGVTLLAGETLTINCAAQTAMKTASGVSTSVKSKLSLDSEFFDILPGTNSITLFDDSPDDITSQMEISFRSSWV
ncbi:MAG: hypothetical protein JWP89_2645 [Schlesneria sp.]|nr:hypothetical protein [Schlesneria sp.]